VIRTIVVDDEMPAREELIYILKGFKNIEIIGEASHGIEALELNKHLKPDLVFLDIQMPKISGIDVARKMLDESHIPLIVFVTAYEEYALDAFDVNAIDYILKPISKERLAKAMDKIINNLEIEKDDYYAKLNKLIQDLNTKETEVNRRISVYDNGKLIPLDLKEIIYATVEDKSTVIISKRGKFEINCTLGQLSNRLNSANFFRSHKSYLINLDLIEIIEPWFNSTFNVKLKNVDEKIPVSRSQSKEFKEIMNID
jgi:DNA-binding LytR/AlgR family response regulator